MRNPFLFSCRRITLASLALGTCCSGFSLFAAQPTPGARTVDEIDQALKRTWTRQDYLEAYARQHELGDWRVRMEKSKGPATLEHGILELAAPAAALYWETKDPKYVPPVRAMLRTEATREPSRGVFALPHVVRLYDRIKDAPELTAEDRQVIESCIARYADLALKREMGAAMNRGLVNLLGLAYACRVLPRHPSRPAWQKAHEQAFATDVLRLQDTNEDSTNYNMLWFMVLVDYVHVSGLDEATFYANPNIKGAFERSLQQISPLGNIPQYGDANWGIGFSPGSFERAASVYQDGRFKWAAQRGANFYRLLPGLDQRMARPHYGLISDWTDDSIRAVPPEARSYYSQRRYGRDFPDKLVLRSGFGRDDSYLLMNLFDGGGHGAADGAAIVSLIDRYSVLLCGSNYDENEERNQNLVLLRGKDESFPFIGKEPTFPLDQWRRATIALREANTSIGGITPDLAKITEIGLRIDPPVGALLIDDVRLVGRKGARVLADFENGLDGWTGELSADSRQGRHSVQLKGALTMPFGLRTPLDLSAYDSLEFWWKIKGGATASSRANVHVVLNSGEHTNRWHWDFLATSRASRVSVLKDFRHAHVASVDLQVNDYLGGRNRQTRDIVMLPGRVVLVRDSFRFGAAQECQVGPLWHVQNVLERGENWFQTSQTQIGGAVHGRPDPNSWQNVPRNLLVYFLSQPHLTIGTAENPNPHSARPTCLFQKWSNAAAEGDTRTFNTLLFPNDPGTAGATIVRDVKILSADNHATVLRLGADLIVVNPAGTLLRAATLETDFRFLVVKNIDSALPYVAGLQGRVLQWEGKRLHQGDATADVEK
jgi:hypothetical protein